ncbi:MAG: glycyl-radical enzyme activating protein, partial [Defluviitaleaceae bacterium]|nr:glycyl-radical enzyme activating protein [Defluviitaleaceae bacterium]
KKFFYHAERCVKCGECRAEACFYDAYEPVDVTISAEELAGKLIRDKAFYEQSGGGVTYSGGEAALQADFFLEVTEILKTQEIHVALDTSGHVPWETLAPLVKAVDLVLYDIKAMDSIIHKRYTGADNVLILENARKIAELRKEMIVRLIVVPGVNENDIEARRAFALGLGSVIEIEELKYHRLGAGKYHRLGLKEPMESL